MTTPAKPIEIPAAVRPYRMSLAEKLYLPLLAGMWVTARHFVRNLFHPKSRYTIEYPEKRREYSHRFRGHHILTTRPDGSVRCVACFLCATACPADCIHIEAGEQPDVNIEKYPTVYEIDLLRCVFCGYCVDACPCNVIYMTRDDELSTITRTESVITLKELVEFPRKVKGEKLGYKPFEGDRPTWKKIDRMKY